MCVFGCRFDIESGSNDGDGYTSVIYRVIIQDEVSVGHAVHAWSRRDLL